MKTFRTHYDNLQVSENASPEVIRGAYRYLSQKWHPDKNPDRVEEAARITRVINAAYEVLSDPQRRKEHDDWIAARRKADTPKQPPRDTESKNTEEPAGARPQAPTPSDQPSLRVAGRMNHEWAWTASLVPVIALVAETLLPPVESYLLWTYISIGAYVLCCSLDERCLKKTSLRAPNIFWLFLVPVYLWQRDSLFGKWRPRFWVWCAAFVVAVTFDSTQYVIGAELSGVWTNEQIGTVELVLGTDPKSISIGGEVVRVKFLNTEGNHATYEFVSGDWIGEKITVRRIWATDDTFTLQLIFFDDPKETYNFGFIRSN